MTRIYLLPSPFPAAFIFLSGSIEQHITTEPRNYNLFIILILESCKFPLEAQPSGTEADGNPRL